ncbi:hypothetical protein EYM_01830 [Ignicoccus islandicus DSM 13165]|uniref:Uncharacterized protein n=1 Tax=Ignicoccus islandicus DSM 13165 TaxID=940295 RepID=A0A0U3EAB3_9CREN|nr:hypothetical protein [Ignicoccus islandicus]ALU12254.1 hypothetical protein EYM_01830 [Ignicoccus islandicus DSM 13165]
MRVVAYDGLPVEVEEAEGKDVEELAAKLGVIANLMRELGISRVFLREDGVAVGES